MTSTSRRRFLKVTAAVAAASAGVGRLAAKTIGKSLCLQLYSVRDLLPGDFNGTLAKVRAAGYTQVETAGNYYNRSAAEFRAAVNQAGLHCTSALHPLSAFEEHGEALIEYGHALGVETLVCLSPGRRDPSLKGPLNLDDWRWTAGKFNRIGEKVKAAGMSFGYHNDIQEFGSEGGVSL